MSFDINRRTDRRRSTAACSWLWQIRIKSSNVNYLFRSLEPVYGLAGRRFAAARRGRLLMTGDDQISPWWSAARHADRKPFLMARGAITKAVRAWFEEQGVSETERHGNETVLRTPQWSARTWAGRLHHTPRSLKQNPPRDADYIASKADCACNLRAEIEELLPFGLSLV